MVSHFRPFSAHLCQFPAIFDHFRHIFGHLWAQFQPVSASSVIVWSLSAIICNFWPCVAHFAADLCQSSTIFDNFRPICLIFCTITAKMRPVLAILRPFSAHFRPFSAHFRPILAHFRYNCGHNDTKFEHLRTIFIFGTFL